MRFFYILTAVLVAAGVYMLVIQRDALLGFAGRDTTEEAEPPAVTGDGTADLSAEQGDPVVEERPDQVRVVALPSKARIVDTAVTLRGRTEAARQVEVRAEISGLIASDPLRKGALVSAGDLLCAIDPGTRGSAVAEARARLREAEARLPASRARVSEAEARLVEAQINDRAAQSLSQSGFAAETRVATTNAAVSSAKAQLESAKTGLETAQAAKESAQAALAGAEKEIDRLSITAPFDGLLESDTAELGALMQPGGLCATIMQLDPIRLVGFVPEAQVNRVELGARARAELISGQQVTGDVSYVSRSADPETRTFRVEITAGNPDLAIRDGQTAGIAIAADGAPAHLLPASALTLDDTGRLGVRIAQETDAGDVAAFQPVTLIRDTTRGVFVEGLPQEARVIVVGQEYITDGVPLEVTLRDAMQGGEAGSGTLPQAASAAVVPGSDTGPGTGTNSGGVSQ